MKKIIILLVGVIAIILLSYYAYNLSEKSKVSGDLSLINFAVKDTSSVDRIEIFDSFRNDTFIVKRSDNGVWVDENGNCVKQEMVGIMLETFLKVTLKGYVPSSAMKNMKKLMMANHKRVKIYQNGQWSKTWFVGHSTADHYGTHMLLETPNKRSDNPVIMGMKGFYGILEPRFSSDPKMYQCSELFSFNREDLKTIKVINNIEPQESFEITHGTDGVNVTSNGQPIEGVNKDNLLFYLNGFKKLHFNRPNYTMSEKDIDSMTNLTPDYQLMIETKHDKFAMDYYRRPDPEAENVDTIYWDRDYLWGVKPDDEVVRMQYFSLGPIIFGQDVFVEKSVNN